MRSLESNGMPWDNINPIIEVHETHLTAVVLYTLCNTTEDTQTGKKKSPTDEKSLCNQIESTQSMIEV